MEREKVILAYSGGLDTSCCVRWLRDRGFRVICFSADLGSEFSPQDLRRRSIASGAEKIYIRDLKQEFAQEYVLRSLKALAVYEGKYLLSTALGRPLIAKHLVDIAQQEKAQFVAHGCTAKGNDQIRFEVSIKILSPHLKVIAPLREWELTSREAEIEYAHKNKIPVKITKAKPYSIDKNIWGVSIEGGKLEDLEEVPPRDSYNFIRPLDKTVNREIEVILDFEEGIPVKLNGRRIKFVEMIKELNRVGALSGIGRTDLIEDRVIGLKSREIYEAPAGWIFYIALKELENLTLDREVLKFRTFIAQKYAELVYQGLWFTPLRSSLDAFIEVMHKAVTGRIVLKLYKGNITVAKRISPYSFYKKKKITYGPEDEFDRKVSEGFIQLWGEPYFR